MTWPLASVLIAAITGLTAAYAIKRLTEPHCYGEEEDEDEPLTIADVIGFEPGDYRDAELLLQEIRTEDDYED